jgi:hypothetical protein
MTHEWRVFREFGFRYWVAYVLVRVAHRVKDTTSFEVIRTQDGSAVLVVGDSWGSGANYFQRVVTDDTQEHPDWPRYRSFEDFDAALDWMRGKDAT